MRRMSVPITPMDNTFSNDKVAALFALLNEKDNVNKKQTHLIEQQAQQIKQLQQQLDWFKRQVFGEKTERRDFTDHLYQTTLADILQDLPALPAKPDEPKHTITYQRGTAKKNVLADAPDDAGLRFDASVPVEEIHIPAPELLGADKDDYTIVSEKVTYRLAQNPASYVVLKYTRPVVKKKSTSLLICPPAPTTVFERSLADVSFLVGLLVDKFVYHLPLYRQHQRLTQNGIVLARSTLTHLTRRAIELLRPIYTHQLQSILHSHQLAIDETPIKAGRQKKGKMQQAYYWPIFGERDEICFTFSASRGMQHLKNQLGDFTGTILSDGYKAYECYARAVSSTTHALCWTHTRRYFIEAEKSEPQACAQALAMIAQLYRHETHLREHALAGQEKRSYRQQHSQPLVDAFFNWIHAQRQRMDLLPKDPFSIALAYTQQREHGLRVFLTDDNVPLDTNHVERALRCIPMGRRNWLFCWTELGAEHVGIIQSLISTCRLHDINPYDYLVDVLQRVDQHPARLVHELTPRLWKEKFSDNPLRSDLYRRNYHLI